MESRGRRPRNPPERLSRPAPRKVPVVYYLTRSRHLEHPHFVEVPAAAPEGLYLRDVVNHLNTVRGKGMASMYSWSCKRSYKNGFVWHDLAEDDLVLPATDGEYILKGSELVDQSSPGRFLHGSNGNQKQQSRLKESPRQPLPREPSYPSSPPSVIVREARSHRRSPSVPPPDEDDTPSPCRGRSTGTMSPEADLQGAHLPASGSASPAEFRVHKPTGCMDAATQTDDLGRRSSRRGPEVRKKSLSTDHDAVVREISEYRQSHPRRSADLQGISRELLSQCPTPVSVASTRGKSESLESLIRADNAANSFRIVEEDDIVVPTCPKLKPTNVLMQLITCGSLSVKDNENIGIVQAYKPRFANLKFPSPLISRAMMMNELDYLSENPRLMGMKLEEKEYFSGSLIETNKMQRDVPAERYSALKRSSSYNAERSGEALDCSRPDEDAPDTTRSRCLPRTPLLSSFLHTKSETLKSPISDCRRSSSTKQDCDLASGDGSRRFADTASARTDSFRREERLVKIEERLSSGARVVIQYTVPCNDSDEGSEH